MIRRVAASLLCAGAFAVGCIDVASAQVPTVSPPLDLQPLHAIAAQSAPAVAFDGASFLLVWEEDADVWAALLDGNGAVLSGRIPMPTDPAIARPAKGSPAVAAGPGGFLVVWAENVAEGNRIRAAHVSGDGVVLDPTGFDVTPASACARPVVAASTAGYLVAWEDGRSDPATPNVYAAFVGATGAATQDFVIGPAAGAQELPSVASNGNGYLVAWQDRRGADLDVYATPVDVAGLVGGSVVFGGSGGDQVRPSATAVGADYVVAWIDRDAGELRAARVANGAALPPGEFLVDASVLDAPHALAGSEPGALALLQGIDLAAHASAIDASGTVGPGAVVEPVIASSGQALAFVGGGTFLATYTSVPAAMLAARFITARYALQVVKTGDGTGSVTSAPAGVDCGATCSAAFDGGTLVTLTAAPDAGSEVTGWTGCTPATAANTCTLTLAAPTTVQVTFGKTVPSAPGTPTFSDIAPTSMTVSWTEAAGAASYELERATASAGPWTQVAAALTAPTYVDTEVAAATRYWYRARGVSASGTTGPWSTTANHWTVPVASTAPTFSAVTASSVTVGWTAVDGASSYRVERAPDEAGVAGTFAAVHTAIGTSWTNTGRTGNTTYWYRVVPVNSGGDGPASPAASVLTLPAAPGWPAAPFGAETTTSITVTWNAPAGGADRYELERAPDAGGSAGGFAPVATGTATSYADGGLSAGTTYWYRVRGVNSAGAGDWSAAKQAVTVPIAVAAAPTFSNVATTSVTVSWAAAEGATGYKVERAPDAGGAPGTFAQVGLNVSGTTVTHSALAANTSYWYRVRAVNPGGDADPSPQASVVTLPNAPRWPSTPFTATTDTTLTVSWTAPTYGAAKYDLERGPTATGPWTRVVSGTMSLSYADSGLSPSTTYWYQVRALNSADAAGAWAAAESVSTVPVAPGTAPTFSAIGTTTLTVSWTAVVGATSYKVERAADVSGAPGTAWTSATSTGSGTEFAATGLAANTAYWYRVRAVNGGGAGAPSPEAKVVTSPNSPGWPSSPFSAVSGTSLTVTWTAPSGGAASYDVERGASVTGPWTRVASGTTALVFADSGLTPSTTYFYQVRALNSAGAAGAFGTAASKLTAPDAPLAAPTFSDIATTSLTVSWTAVAGATGYKVERAPDVSGAPGTWTATASSGTGTTFAATLLAANTGFWYRVRATNATGDGAPSPEAKVVTLPNAPGGISFPSVGTYDLTVSWAAPSGGAASYELERAPDVSGAAGTYARIVTVNGTTYAESGLAASTAYWYRVRALNVAGAAGAYGTPRSQLTKPDAPGAPTYSSVTTVSVAMQWGAAVGATSYKVERAADGGGVPGAWSQIATGVAGTTYTDDGRWPNTRYWYRVRATNAAGDGPYSPYTTIITVPNAPAWTTPPFTDITRSSLTVNWIAPAGGAAAYAVERAPDVLGAPGAFARVATGVTGLTYADTTLSPDTRYWYRVIAGNAEGRTSDPSAARSVTTLADTPIATPGAPTYSSIKTTSVTVSWTAAAGATAYKLERAPDAARAPGTWTLIANQSVTSRTDNALTANLRYWYRVRGTSSGGDGPVSPVTSVMTVPNAPGAPTFSAIGPNALTVSWAVPVAGAASYALERATTSNGPWTVLGNGLATPAYGDASLAPNTAYWYRVRAANEDGGLGAYSAVASVTTAPDATPVPGPAGAPTYSTVSTTYVKLSWAPSAGATAYDLERAPDAGGAPGTFTSVATGLAATAFTDAGLVANAAYWYRVRGTNAGGPGPYSEATTVVTLPNAPGAPTFSLVAANSVTVSWTPPAGGASAFLLERARASTGPWAQLVSVPTTSWVDATVAANTTYWYRVRATNLLGAAGPYSASRSITTAVEAISPPDAVGGIAFASVAARTLTVTWQPSARATSYRVERAPDSAGVPGSWALVASGVTTTAQSDSGRAGNTKYWYRVRASNGGGDAPWSAAASVVTAPNAPGAPKFAEVGPTSLTVSWTAPSGGAASYVVERATASAGPWSIVATGVTALTVRDTGLAPATRYYYRVRAVNVEGRESSSSATRNATTTATPLSG